MSRWKSPAAVGAFRRDALERAEGYGGAGGGSSGREWTDDDDFEPYPTNHNTLSHSSGTARLFLSHVPIFTSHGSLGPFPKNGLGASSKTGCA